MIENIPIGAVRTDGGTQTRARLDDDTIADYRMAMLTGATFPAIIVFYDGTKYWLADGFHRLAAAGGIMNMDATAPKTIAADVHQGTRRDAVLHAVSANARHGLRRTNADKQRAVEALLRDPEWVQWSDREIGRRCQVDPGTVSAVRQRLEAAGEIPSITERQAADGRVMKTTGIAAANAQRATPQLPEVAEQGELHPIIAQAMEPAQSTPSAMPPALPIMTHPASTMPPALFPVSTPAPAIPPASQETEVIAEIEDRPRPAAAPAPAPATPTPAPRPATAAPTPLPRPAAQLTPLAQPGVARAAAMPPALPIGNQVSASDQAAKQRVAKIAYLRQFAALAEQAAAELQPGDERFELDEGVAGRAVAQYVASQGFQAHVTMLAFSVTEAQPEPA